MANTRKQICFRVSHPYRTGTEGVPPFGPSPCTVVGFPSKENPNFKLLRHLHEKEVQTIVTTKDKGVQTEVRVPCPRWTQMQPQEVEEERGHLEDINKTVLVNLQKAVEETASVDPLHDAWGSLSEYDQTDALLHPLKTLQRRAPVSIKESIEELEQEFHTDDEIHFDIVNIHRIKEKIKKKLERQRTTVVSTVETPVEKFMRIYEKQLRKSAENTSSEDSEEKET